MNMSSTRSSFGPGFFKLPPKMMMRWIGEDIGDRIGELMEVDAMEDGLAMGKYP
jgi:hypothetical protein